MASRLWRICGIKPSEFEFLLPFSMEQSGIVPADVAISVSKPDRGRIAPRMELLSCAIHVPGSIRSHVVAVGLGIILSSHQCSVLSFILGGPKLRFGPTACSPETSPESNWVLRKCSHLRCLRKCYFFNYFLEGFAVKYRHFGPLTLLNTGILACVRRIIECRVLQL